MSCVWAASLQLVVFENGKSVFIGEHAKSDGARDTEHTEHRHTRALRWLYWPNDKYRYPCVRHPDLARPP